MGGGRLLLGRHTGEALTHVSLKSKFWGDGRDVGSICCRLQVPPGRISIYQPVLHGFPSKILNIQLSCLVTPRALSDA